MATEATKVTVWNPLEQEGLCLAALCRAATEHGFEFVTYKAVGSGSKRGMAVEFQRRPGQQETAVLAGQDELPLKAGEEQNGPAALSDEPGEEPEKPKWYQQ